MADHDYRVLVVRTGRESLADRLHLVREDAEATLCGIPRSALGPGQGGELVCPDCIDWLARRKTVSGPMKRVPPRSPEG